MDGGGHARVVVLPRAAAVCGDGWGVAVSGLGVIDGVCAVGGAWGGAVVSWRPVCGGRVRVGGAGEKWSVALLGRRGCGGRVRVCACAAVAPEGEMRSGP